VAAAAPVLVTVVSVEVIGTAGARIHWSAAISTVVVAPDGGFTIDGFAPESASDVFGDPAATDVVNNTDWNLAPGSLWDLLSQPNWLVTPASIPDNGVCF
jgi:hypothetical protein